MPSLTINVHRRCIHGVGSVVSARLPHILVDPLPKFTVVPCAAERPLDRAQIAAWKPFDLNGETLPAMQRARRRMEDTGQWADWQLQGRRMAIGCVALEITQRCNLDCTYCYLSESSQALKDIPLEEVFRRIDLIHAHYGANTDVQVTGGEPTLRRRDELIAIVARIKSRGMRSSLFTNGIKASRELLVDLCAAGLEDVAFHVDLTQGRKGYASEAALNELRLDCMARARGLPLSVLFNTTVHPGNFHEVPALVAFFAQHADVVRLASFQVGADTGRGPARERVAVDTGRVIEAIRQGASAALNFDAAGTGHASCNRYASALVVGGRVHDLHGHAALVARIIRASAHLVLPRARAAQSRQRIAWFLATHPRIAAEVALRFAAFAWRQRRDLLRARGRIHKLSFFVHNFMDAAALDTERCAACSFMVMTPAGPLSMCVHNAKRDDYLLVPARVTREHALLFFNPATGALGPQAPQSIRPVLDRKNRRGRGRIENRATV